MGILDGIQDTYRDVSFLAYLRESLPSSGWAWASRLLGYQEAPFISGPRRETTTSPAQGLTRAEARWVRERVDIEVEDEGLSWPTHPTTVISGQWQSLALKFSPQDLSWEATLSMGWPSRGSGVVRWRIGTHLRHQIRSAIKGKQPSSHAVPDIRATCIDRQGRTASSWVLEDVAISPSTHQ